MAQVSAPKCDICKKVIANVFCYECRHFLCQSCKSFHEKFPATKRHTVTDSSNVDRSILILATVCEDHKLEFVYYCQDCECLICVQCVTSGHQHHSFTGITEVAAVARGDVMNRLVKIKDSVETVSNLIKAFKRMKKYKLEAGTEKFTREVHEVSQDLVKIIEKVTDINLSYATDFLDLEKQKGVIQFDATRKCIQQAADPYQFSEKIIKDKIVAVAIHIGTNETGFAYKFNNEFGNDPSDISSLDIGSRNSMTTKVPNSILLDPAKRFVAFGKDAEDQFFDLVREASHHDWYFFDQFTKNIPVLIYLVLNFLDKNFLIFPKKWEFEYVTSSPHNPTSNGLAEKTVKIVKTFVLKCKKEFSDPNLALLDYRTCPLSLGFSPYQLLMSRKLRSILPGTFGQFLLQSPNYNVVQDELFTKQACLKKYYDVGFEPLKPIETGDPVCFTCRHCDGLWKPAFVSSKYPEKDLM
ncbi:unnamed protein product [Mytilus coruscus]|uniref:B box-type domain-containing protein n=1 Tax=Mytilus coruscus TaxID=42192 RepID=A0A6J8DEN2_MYTCO|nr:unnamed protein product [Mytilus coruscus]